MKHLELLNAEELLKTWNLVLHRQKHTLPISDLPAKVLLYQQWSTEIDHAFSYAFNSHSHKSLLNRTLQQLTETWRLSIDRVIKLEIELKAAGKKLHIKSFKAVNDELLHQLMLVILTLHERAVVEDQQSRLYDMIAGQFVKLMLDLHTSRTVKEQPLNEMLLLLKKECETFPALLSFKLIEPGAEHADLIWHIPRPLFNLIFSQGLQTARLMIRTGQPHGMKSLEWETLLAAALLQDVGLTMGWGLGTPRQHVLKGQQAEQQLAAHAQLGAGLLKSLKKYRGLSKLVSEHHHPLNVKQLRLRTRLSTLEHQNTLLQIALKPVHLLYRPIEEGMHLDFLPCLVAQQQMVKLLKREEMLTPQFVSPLLKVLNESEDHILNEHIDKLLPNIIQDKAPEYSRIDQAHEFSAQQEIHEFKDGIAEKVNQHFNKLAG